MPSISPQPQMVITHSSSTHEGMSSGHRTSPTPSSHQSEDVEHQPIKVEKSSSFRFKDLRKRSKESLSFRRRKRHTEPGSLDSSMLSVNHPYATSPVSPKSPISPSSIGATGNQCRCRRCSLLPLEECEPKEVSALFKFLRKSKVNMSSFLKHYSVLRGFNLQVYTYYDKTMEMYFMLHNAL